MNYLKFSSIALTLLIASACSEAPVDQFCKTHLYGNKKSVEVDLSVPSERELMCESFFDYKGKKPYAVLEFENGTVVHLNGFRRSGIHLRISLTNPSASRDIGKDGDFNILMKDGDGQLITVCPVRKNEINGFVLGWSEQQMSCEIRREHLARELPELFASYTTENLEPVEKRGK